MLSGGLRSLESQLDPEIAVPGFPNAFERLLRGALSGSCRVVTEIADLGSPHADVLYV